MTLAFVPPTPLLLPHLVLNLDQGLTPSLLISTLNSAISTLNSAISYHLAPPLNFPCTPSPLQSLSVVRCRVLEVAVGSPLSDRRDMVDGCRHQQVASLCGSLGCVLHHLVPNVDLGAVPLPAV